MMNHIKLQALGFSLLKSGQLNSSMHLQEQGDTCEEVKLKEEVLYGILSFTIRCKIIVQAIKKVYGT